MDGIFGVGLAELVLVGLVLFIIGGPKNTMVWARQLGQWVRRGRQEWAKVMASFEQELGSDGKEVLDAVREIGQDVRDLRSVGSPQSMIRGSLRSDLLGLPDTSEPPASSAETPSAAAEPSESPSMGKTYPAWLPPEAAPSDDRART